VLDGAYFHMLIDGVGIIDVGTEGEDLHGRVTYGKVGGLHTKEKHFFFVFSRCFKKKTYLCGGNNQIITVLKRKKDNEKDSIPIGFQYDSGRCSSAR
jgi:hypothetical protein